MSLKVTGAKTTNESRMEHLGGKKIYNNHTLVDEEEWKKKNCKKRALFWSRICDRERTSFRREVKVYYDWAGAKKLQSLPPTHDQVTRD